MSFNYMLILACLCAGLLFDPNGFLRMALLASVLHELGHILAYVICKHALPPITFTFGGFSMGNTSVLSRNQESFVIFCGPLVNLLIAAFLCVRLNIKASYILYFFMATNLIIGGYNLLPFGVLDGAKLIKNVIPYNKEHLIYTVQKIILIVFTTICVVIAVWWRPKTITFLSLIIAPLYLWICEFKK